MSTPHEIHNAMEERMNFVIRSIVLPLTIVVLACAACTPCPTPPSSVRNEIEEAAPKEPCAAVDSGVVLSQNVPAVADLLKDINELERQLARYPQSPNNGSVQIYFTAGDRKRCQTSEYYDECRTYIGVGTTEELRDTVAWLVHYRIDKLRCKIRMLSKENVTP